MYIHSDIMIVINSSNRVGKIKTHGLFPENVIKHVIAVPVDQAPAYREVYGDVVWEIPEEVPQFLPSQRQHMAVAMEPWVKYIWFMDDDLTFFTRGSDLKLHKATPADIERMFHLMVEYIKEVPMVGISTRLGNNRITADYDEINRVTRCYTLDLDVFKKVGATFAPFEPFVSEDFHMALCFLNKGYRNRIIHTFAQEDVGSNAEGGCSLYRTPAIQRKTAFWMADNHPEVTVRAKDSNNWKGFEEKRVDMTVQWKKAYKPKKEKLPSFFKTKKAK